MNSATNQPKETQDTKVQWQVFPVSSGYTFVNSVTVTPDLGGSVEQNTQRHIPFDKFEKYVRLAMKRANFPKMEDENFFADIPGFPGVWASDETLKDCLDALEEVLRDWLLLKIKDRDKDIPVIEGINLNII